MNGYAFKKIYKHIPPPLNATLGEKISLRTKERIKLFIAGHVYLNNWWYNCKHLVE